MNTPQENPLHERCREEIDALHQFFEDWLGGARPDTDDAFVRVRCVLADEFRLIHPAGEWRTRDEILSGLRRGHGRRPGLTIEIRNAQVLRTGPERCLAAYKEWQHGPDATDGRLSSVVFRREPTDLDLPEGLVWEHVHETWIQSPSEA